MPKTVKAILTMAACLAAALLPCAPLAAQGAPLVAIMEPYGNARVTAMTKNTVMGVVRDGLLDDGRYEAVTRDTLDRVMKEHAFQRSDFADSGSAKRIGRMLGADMICVVDITREGGEINVAVQMIDVETGRIAHSGSRTFATESNTFVHEITQEIMEKMMRQRGAAGRGAAPQGDRKSAPAPQTAAPARAQGLPLIAVLDPFDRQRDAPEIDKDTVRMALMEGLLTLGKYRVLDHGRVDGIMQEQEFEWNDLVSPDPPERLRKLLRADFICVTDIEGEDQDYFIAIRIISLETGKIIHYKGIKFSAYPPQRTLRREVMEMVK